MDILTENPIAIKCTIVAIIAAKIKSFNRFQLIKNADNEGIVIIIAMIVPLTKISFEWDMSSDNYGVAFYNIYRDGVKLTSTYNTSFIDSGLSGNTEYTYEISAVDGYGNESVTSSPLLVSTNDFELNTAKSKACEKYKALRN